MLCWILWVRPWAHIFQSHQILMYYDQSSHLFFLCIFKEYTYLGDQSQKKQIVKKYSPIIFFLRFYLKVNYKERGRDWEILSTCSLPKSPWQQGLGQAWTSTWVSHVDGRGPSTWLSSPAFPSTLNKILIFKNTYFHTKILKINA